MLACWDCKNLQAFVQVSERADARDVTQTPKHGMVAGNWDRPDSRRPGLYCGSCENSIDALVEDFDLADRRIEFLRPEDFRADLLADEVMRLRDDATWRRIDLPPRPAAWGDLDGRVQPWLREALTRVGRIPLYCHQAEAIAATLDGENVVQATAAGSGKSLGFTVPVLDALSSDAHATAVLVFPLRALANDQLNSLARLSASEDPWIDPVSFDLDLGEGARTIRVARYDGSTPKHLGKAIRAHARLLITTPDTIHASILRMAARRYKDKSAWDRLLGGLRYVVLDEIHSYQGVFGSNVAQVLRRLRRAAAWHGSSPQFLAASATIGNPVELAERLTGTSPFRLVDRDGAPQRGRTVLICNPPVVTEQGAKKRKTQKGSDTERADGRIAPQTIALELIAAGALASDRHLPVRTICFGRSRGEVFALTKRIQARLGDLKHAQLGEMVTAYAATLMSDDRVATEGSLRDGSLLAVVSTNALELGIDIPDLSLAVLCGYPGQISSFRQRAGRCGRAGEGLVVLIVGDDPLQQHLANRPETLSDLLAARAEDVVINPDAPEVAKRYGLIPAESDLGGVAYEDGAWFSKDAVEAWLARVEGSPTLVHDGVPYWRTLADGENDAYDGIRSAAAQHQYHVYAASRSGRESIGVLDAGSGPRDAFPGAIWNGPKGVTYRVTSIDHRAHEIACEGPVAVPYLTRGVPVDTVDVTAELAPKRSVGDARIDFAALTIRRNVYSYKEMHFSGVEKSCQIEGGRWPEQAFTTQGMCVTFDPAGLPAEPRPALKAVEHLLLALAPTVSACDPYDLDAASDAGSIYVYDSFGGGIGISRPVYDRFEEVLDLAYETIATCPCDQGCPGCIVLSRRPDGNRELSKSGAARLLELLRAPSQ